MNHFCTLVLIGSVAVAANAFAEPQSIPGTYFRAPPEAPATTLTLGKTVASKTIALPAVTSAERSPAMLKSTSSNVIATRTGAREIGIVRDVPVAQAMTDLGALSWQPSSDGGLSTQITIRSTGAEAVRAELSLVGSASGLTFRFSDSAPDSKADGSYTAGSYTYGPYTWRELESMSRWSPIVEGDSMTLEITVAPGFTPVGRSLSVAHVAHQDVSSVRERATGLKVGPGSSGSCNIDIACIASQQPAAATTAASSARISFVMSGRVFECSGQLINSTDAQGTPTNIPYFTTANHCISTATAAGTIQFFWFYQSATCRGTTAPTQRTPKQKADLAAHYRTFAPLLEPVRKQIAAVEAKLEGLNKAMPRTMVAMPIEPRMVRVLPRGNWLDDSGAPMEPAVPVALGRVKAGNRRATRLDLAEWLASRDNPLVARVFVNRLWKIMFGRGLVTTLEDFGAQGTNPSHPEVLDWLASDFLDGGWNIKQTLKRIALTDAYQRTSRDTPDLRFKDPYNAQLARQGRFRLEAEMVRDNALAISGLLIDSVGGGSVKPYQPPGYWSYLNFPKREWENSAGESSYRRGLYTYFWRSAPHPQLVTFDAPDSSTACTRRNRSNTPLQALTLLNDAGFYEYAQGLVARIFREASSNDAGRLAYAFRVCVAREPSARELARLRALLESQRDDLASKPAEAAAISPTAPDRAAWVTVARVLLNLDETITRE